MENGVTVLKFFLNVSKEEQKRRFLERIERPEKNWKFSAADVRRTGLLGPVHGGLPGSAWSIPARSGPPGT